MSKPTEEEIEDRVCLAIYDTLNNEDFHQFYIDEGEKSLTAHICGDINSPTKEEILLTIKSHFSRPLIKVIKDICNDT